MSIRRIVASTLVGVVSANSELFAVEESCLNLLQVTAAKADTVTVEGLEERLDRIEKMLGTLVKEEDGSRVPTKMAAGDDSLELKDLSVFERMRHLEHKVDGGLNWLKDPQLFEETQHTCYDETTLETDHHICFDNWDKILAKRQASGKPEKCVVYDLGIRANPEFGVNLMKDYGCSVRAYDPSPTSQDWWKNEKNDAEDTKVVSMLKEAGESMYKFRDVGAGGEDGNVQLYEYSWQQVAIYKAEDDHTARPKDSADVAPKAFNLPVKTLHTMMKDNGDSYIDILKIDIEGSEYLFMQDIFDRMGCPPVGQIQLEWHHFSLDSRYGSSPEMNAIHNLLNSCGFQAFYNRDHWRASPEWTQGARQIPPMRYTLAAYCKDCMDQVPEEERSKTKEEMVANKEIISPEMQ